MTWARIRQPSLFDTIDRSPTEWWLMYHDVPDRRWWDRFLAPGFQHVSAFRRDGRLWIHVAPTIAFTDVNVLRTDANPWEMFPTATFQRVTSMRSLEGWRVPWVFSPMTCVEMCKGLLGIREFWLFTPYQLYQFCKSGVIHG